MPSSGSPALKNRATLPLEMSPYSRAQPTPPTTGHRIESVSAPFLQKEPSPTFHAGKSDRRITNRGRTGELPSRAVIRVGQELCHQKSTPPLRRQRKKGKKSKTCSSRDTPRSTVRSFSKELPNSCRTIRVWRPHACDKLSYATVVPTTSRCIRRVCPRPTNRTP